MAFPESRPSEIRNRIEALRRVPDYQKAFAQWTRLAARVKHTKKRTNDTDLAALSACEQAIRRRWKVRPPFPPPASVPFDEWERLRGINPLDEVVTVEVINPAKVRHQTIIGDLVNGYDPVRLEADYESFRQKHGNGKMIFRGGKHLCLIIDVTRTKTELLREITGYLQCYQRMLPKDKSRKKPTAIVDIWKVYDQHQNGMPLAKIAKQYMTRNPGEAIANPREAAHTAVKRGYEKAVRLICEVM